MPAAVGDQGLVVSLGRDGQDAGDHLGVLGVAQRCVAEQRADRGEPDIAGPGTVAPVAFEVIQECADQRGVQVVQVQLAGLLFALPGGEREQEAPGVAGEAAMVCGLAWRWRASRSVKDACRVGASAVMAGWPGEPRGAARQGEQLGGC